MEISKFNEKFNKLEGNIYAVEEQITLTDGVYNGLLAHDNINKKTINIYTGIMLTGDKITNYFLSTPSETPWKYSIKIMAPNVDKVYVSYETIGDQVEAEDINNLQNEIIRTQQEVNIIDGRVVNVENNKADKDKVYTKEEVLQKINDLINGAPGTLDTLNEIATALGNDPNFSATIINLLNNKADKVTGKQFSTEDYSTQEKNKLAKIEDNANNYIHPNSHPANIITEDATHMFVTAEEKAAINTTGNNLVFETAGGTGNVITLTLPTLTNGYAKTFISSASNGGTETTINTKKLCKPGTTTPPTLTAGKAYTVWYNLAGDCFFIKASAEGNVTQAHVLAGDGFSNDNDVGLIGLMPNNGAVTNTIASAGGTYTIPLGYHNGLGVITAPSLASATSEGTVSSNSQILNGYKCYSNGTLYTGTIPSKGTTTYSPSTVAQTIALGQYLSGIQTINPVTGTANVAQVLSGYTFASANGIGLTGTIPSKTAQTYTPTTTDQIIASGQYLGEVQTIKGDANLLASNIASGSSIFGVVGSYNQLIPIAGATSLLYYSPTYYILTSTLYAGAINFGVYNQSGIIRISFGLKATSSSHAVNGRIYINGVAVGTERITFSTTAVTYTEDFVVKAGDSIMFCGQVYSATYNGQLGAIRITCGNSYCSIQ